MELQPHSTSQRPRRIRKIHEPADARVIATACRAWREVGTPIPICVEDRILGWMCGDPIRKQTLFTRELPLELGPLPTYDSYVENLTGSTIKRYMFQWEKASDSPVISNWYDYWRCVGNPTNGVYTGSARVARQFTDATQGAMVHGGDVAPAIKFVARFTAQGFSAPRAHVLYDRVIDYPGCVFSNAGFFSMDNTLTAQRYVDKTKGEPGLQMCMTQETTSNATAANCTLMSYDDVNGVAQTMPTSPAVAKIVSGVGPSALVPSRVIAPATAGGSPFLPLGSAYPMVQKVKQFAWSASPTGTFCLVLMYPIAWLADAMVSGQASDFDYTNGLFQYAQFSNRVFDGAALNILSLIGSATDSLQQGIVEFQWK